MRNIYIGLPTPILGLLRNNLLAAPGDDLAIGSDPDAIKCSPSKTEVLPVLFLPTAKLDALKVFSIANDGKARYPLSELT